MAAAGVFGAVPRRSDTRERKPPSATRTAERMVSPIGPLNASV